MRKKEKIRELISIISQVILGLIFIFAATLKAIDFQIFIQSLQSFKFLPQNTIVTAAIVIIILELIIGFTISINLYIKTSLVIGIGLLSIFVIVGLYSVLAGKNWICACFGSVFIDYFSLSTVIRDALILIIAIFIYLNHSKGYSFGNSQNWVPTFVVISIISLSVVLLAATLNKNDIQIKGITIGNRIKDLQARSLDGKLIDTSKRTSPFLLLIIFDTEKDCASCLVEFSLWKYIYDNFPEIDVVGIAYSRNQDFLQAWLSVRKITFPVIFDIKRNLLNEFNISTPMKILLNSKNKILTLQKSSDNQHIQSEFIKEINDFIKDFNDPTSHNP